MKIIRKTWYKEVHERELSINTTLANALNQYLLYNAIIPNAGCWIPLTARDIYTIYAGKISGKPLHPRGNESLMVDIAKNGKMQTITLAQFVYWFIDETLKSGLYSINHTEREFVDTVDKLHNEEPDECDEE